MAESVANRDAPNPVITMGNSQTVKDGRDDSETPPNHESKRARAKRFFTTALIPLSSPTPEGDDNTSTPGIQERLFSK